MMKNFAMKLGIFIVVIFVCHSAYFGVNAAADETEEQKCGKFNSTCGECTDDKDCFWCGSTDSCHSYNIIPKDCSKAQWFVRQCTIAGFWIIIVAPCVAVFLIVSLICCCWCCCCRKDKAKEEEKYRLKDSRRQNEKDQRRAYFEEKNKDRELERDKIRTKYGLYNDSSSGGYNRMNEP